MSRPIQLLAILLAVLSTRVSAAEGLPEARFPACFAMQTKPKTSSAEDFAAIKALGATLIRRGFYWNGTEPVKGEYDFTDADRVIADAEANGLRVLGVLFNNNKLYESTEKGNRGIITEEGRQGYAAFAAALAGRFKGKGILWEIWNEPNTMTFWGKHGKVGNTPAYAAEYTALVKACVPAMRAADPDCLILAGSVSCLWEPSFTWTDACFAEGLGTLGISALSLHPYGFKRPEDYAGGYARIHEILAKHGVDDLPLVNSERGYSVEKLKEGWSGGTIERAEEFQAWHLVRQALIDAMLGLRFTVWYEWKDGPFGLIDGGKTRPAMQAARVMATQLDGFAFTERLPMASDLDYVLRLTNTAGIDRLVVWCAPPAGESPDAVVEHEIAIPVIGSQVGIVGLMGGEPRMVPIVDGKITLTIGGAAQYLSPVP